MTKINIPLHSFGEFESLQQALTVLKQKDSCRSYMLADIVLYNVCYRDHLRKHGLRSLERRLITEAPELKDDTKALEQLRKCLDKVGPIADYDIQCHDIGHHFTVFGHTFHGLVDVYEHSRLYRNYGEAQQEHSSGVYVQAYHESYPQFDSFDACDNRTYQNYIFREISCSTTPKPNRIPDYFEANHHHMCRSVLPKHDRFPHCMVHEDIPSELLPILYYPGDGRFFLLATPKEPTWKDHIRKKCRRWLGTILKNCLYLCGYSLKVRRRTKDIISFTITKNTKVK